MIALLCVNYVIIIIIGHFSYSFFLQLLPVYKFIIELQGIEII